MASTYPAKKNAAFTAVFPILDADGDPVVGAAGLDSEVSKDGGGFTDCTNEASEIATSSGVYKLDLEAGEMNADVVAIIVKTSTEGAKTTVLVFYTAAHTLDEIYTVIINIGLLLTDVDTEVGNIETKLDSPEDFMADVSALDSPENFMADISALALEATLDDLKGDGWTDESLKDIQDLAAALKKIGTNRWQIIGNQLIVYDDDGLAPLYTFDLKDSDGEPAMENVFERTPA